MNFSILSFQPLNMYKVIFFSMLLFWATGTPAAFEKSGWKRTGFIGQALPERDLSNITRINRQTRSGGNGYPVEIVKLANDLKNDPELIVRYVHENIRLYPSYGVNRSALGTLLDRHGNYFEQANLTVMLLQAAGHTDARVVVGSTSFTDDFFKEQVGMFGAKASHFKDLVERLGREYDRNRDMSYYLDYTEVLAGVFFERPSLIGVWDEAEQNAIFAQLAALQDAVLSDFPMAFVEVNIDGQNQLFAPGIKNTVDTISSGIFSPIENTLGDERRSSFYVNSKFSEAINHADLVINSLHPYSDEERDYKTSLDRERIHEILDTGSSDFVDFIKSNYPDAGVEQLIGNEYREVSPELLTYTTTRVDASWSSETDIPVEYLGSVKFVYQDINYEIPVADVYDAPFYLTFSGHGKPLLKLGAQTLQTGTQATYDEGVSGELQMVLPTQPGHSSTTFVQNDIVEVYTDGLYNFVVNVGRTSVEQLESGSQKITESIATNGEHSVLTKAHVLRGIGIYYHYFLSIQEQLNNKLYFPIHNLSSLGHTGTHDVSENGFPFISIGASRALYYSYSDRTLFSQMTWASLAESIAIEDTQGISSTSTMSCFDFINNSGNHLIKVAAEASDNVADIDDAIDVVQNGWPIGWSYSSLLGIKNELESNTSASALIPLKTSGTPDFPRGCYLFISDEYVAYRVANSYDGGVADENAELDADFYENFYEGKQNHEGIPVYSTTVNDPINFLTGDFLYENNDIITGSGKGALGFRRSYDSSVQENNHGLGTGWVHNYAVSIEEGTALDQAFGSDSVIDAAPYLTAIYLAMKNDYYNEGTTYHLMHASIAAWALEKIRNNAVILKNGHKKETFIKLPGNKYNPPPHSDQSLSVVNGNYVITGRNGSVMTFNSGHQLAEMTARNGDTVTLTYGTGQQLESVSNNYGRKIKLVYSGDSLEKVQDIKADSSVLREVEFRYTGDSLTGYINAVDETTTYGYDSNGYLDSIYYPQFPGVSALINYYDEWGRVHTQTSPDGGDHYYYYADGWRSEETGPSAQSLIHYFDEMGNTTLSVNGIGESQKFEFDGANRLSSVTSLNDSGNAMNVSRYSYFLNHLVQYQYVTELLADGSEGDVFGSGYSYKEQYGLVSTISEIKGITRTTDRFGFVTTTPVESRVVQTNTYDTEHKLESVTTASFEDKDGNDLTPVVSFQYYDASHNVEFETAPDGLVTQYTYYSTGEIKEIIVDPDTDENSSVANKHLTTSFTYNDWGDVETVTNPLNQVTYTEFDAQRRLRKQVNRYDLVDDDTPSIIETRIEYPGGGLVTTKQKSDNPALHPTGWVVSNSQYNKAGKLVTISDHVGDTVTYEYDIEGRVEYITDPEGRKAKFTYDTIHRLLTQNRLKADGSYIKTAEYSYDYLNGAPKVSLFDANNNESVFQYDRLQRLTRTTYPDASYETLEYFDHSPLVKKSALRDTSEIIYQYDGLNRVKSVQFGNEEMNSIYHLLNGQVDTVKQFMPAGAASSEDVDYAYDYLGRIDYVNHPNNKKTDYDFDDLGRRTVLTYPSNSVVISYIYDDFNRVQHIRRGATNLATYEYNSLSQVVKITYSNNTFTDITYEADGDIESIVHSFKNNETLGYRYTYNSAGQVNGSETIGLAQHWLPETEKTVDFTPNNLNQYDDAEGVTLDYNANGQLEDDASYTYRHDLKGALRSVKADSQTIGIDFKYNALGQRTEKDSYGDVYKYTYDGPDVLQEYQDNTINLQFIHGPGIDQPVMMLAGNNSYFLHADKMGSIVAVSDVDGELVERYAYSPFGLSHDTSLLGNPYRFTSRWLDSETDKYYFRARYYDQSWGRFMQPDPIGYADGLNMYSYVSNDPLNFHDPLGLSQRYHINHSSLTSLYANNNYNYAGTIAGIASLAADDELIDILGLSTFNEFKSFLNDGFAIIHERMEEADSYSYAGLYIGGFVRGMLSHGDAVVATVRRWSGGGAEAGTTVTKGLAGVPGRVQSRINLKNSGWNHVLDRHFNPSNNASQFTVSQKELRSLLQSKNVVGTPVTRTLNSADGVRYVREVNVGRNIGLDKFSNMQPTSTMSVLTDKFGNLVTATPGVIK